MTRYLYYNMKKSFIILIFTILFSNNILISDTNNKTGNLIIKINFKDVKIYIDDIKMNTVKISDEQYKITNINPGNHLLEIIKDEYYIYDIEKGTYQNYKENIYINSEKTKYITVRLEHIDTIKSKIKNIVNWVPIVSSKELYNSYVWNSEIKKDDEVNKSYIDKKGNKHDTRLLINFIAKVEKQERSHEEQYKLKITEFYCDFYLDGKHIGVKKKPSSCFTKVINFLDFLSLFSSDNSTHSLVIKDRDDDNSIKADNLELKVNTSNYEVILQRLDLEF